MLLRMPKPRETENIRNLIDHLPQVSESTSFGEDIDKANEILLSEKFDVDTKVSCFLKWISRYSPCLLGRAASKDRLSMSMDIHWITEEDIEEGDNTIQEKLQAARRAWKDRAAEGISHGFLVFFNSKKIAYCKPGKELLELSRRIGDLYLPECRPIDCDVVYTEAMPLRYQDGSYGLFKGGINLFYTTGHRTRNNDRRIPGGLMVSVNSPGHYANSLVQRGIVPSLKEAAAQVLDLAWRSIGNGGIGGGNVPSTSWHNKDDDRPTGQCPMRHRPAYIPENFSTLDYSALYHTDVLVPTDVTTDDRDIADVEDPKVWRWLVIDYMTEKRFAPDHGYYGLFQGHPIDPEARYHNPWPPRIADNSPWTTSDTSGFVEDEGKDGGAETRGS